MVKSDKQYRDYRIEFLLNGEFQVWIGESRSLLHSHPTAKIINIQKIKRNE